jgi:HD-GYP domain-containing protein (c-di-GMP phosphodiesterase class II)
VSRGKVDSSYLAIDRETILGNAVHAFDIFFQSGEGNLFLYCASGQKVGEDIIAKIRDHPSERFYINKRDRYHYHVHVEDHLDAILEAPDLHSPRKAAVAYQSILFVADQLFKNPKADLVRRYKKTVSHTMDLVLKDTTVLQNLIRLTTFDFSILNHSVNVGIFSVGLMQEFMGELKGEDVKEVAAGFFLHDIGKCRVPPDILMKKGPLSPVEWKMVRNHVDEGRKILLEQNQLTKEALPIITQHHERHDGTGYPRGIRGDSIHPHARICSIADAFDGLTSYRPFRKEYSSFEAMKIMKNEMFRDFDPAYFQKFVRLFSGH